MKWTPDIKGLQAAQAMQVGVFNEKSNYLRGKTKAEIVKILWSDRHYGPDIRKAKTKESFNRIFKAADGEIFGLETRKL